MKVSYHKYDLLPPVAPHAGTASHKRSGALLKIEWPSGRCGYSDVHPWPELGDEPLAEQLSLLKSLKLTRLTEQSVWFAKRDAAARAENRSLWLPGVQVRNNALVLSAPLLQIGDIDRLVGHGFTTLKIKCGRDLEREAETVNRIAGRSDLFVRLDFNGALTPALFEKFMGLVNKESDGRIEYVEDPFPYDHEAWREIRKRWRLALDYELDRSPWKKGERPMADVLILKPARMDVDSSVEQAMKLGLGVTVTSSMDHPVGVVHAHAVAQELKKKHDPVMRTAGCLTLGVYRVDEFSASVPVQGPFISKMPGTGIGFDNLLKALPWKPISDL